MASEKESWRVRSIKYIENNYHHLYKNFEALILFMLSAYCLADFTTLKKDILLFIDSINDTQINTWLILKNIFSSYPLYLIAGLLIVSIFITRKVSSEAQKIEAENRDLKAKISTKEQEFEKANLQLNEAEEAIDSLKDSNLETSFEIGSKFIAYLSQKWSLTSRERISLYLETSGHFVLSARYSLDSEFEKVHRKQFPINQGIIGECWRLRRRFVKHLPKTETAYIKECERQNFTENEIKCFTMKSKTLIAFPISRDNFEKIGVLVIESTKDDWNFDENSELIDEYHVLFRQFLIHYEKTINACQREVAK